MKRFTIVAACASIVVATACVAPSVPAQQASSTTAAERCLRIDAFSARFWDLPPDAQAPRLVRLTNRPVRGAKRAAFEIEPREAFYDDVYSASWTATRNGTLSLQWSTGFQVLTIVVEHALDDTNINKALSARVFAFSDVGGEKEAGRARITPVRCPWF